ncbi:hypothetical protein [Mesomycoplasma dispar]|uniref:hypothetical protein n=1 Tax=Mesomycoplasma dispar TaxID=86660 RepID=UPI001E5E66D7|nr:hypothetical protein [Mesomycoplasma dispar]
MGCNYWTFVGGLIITFIPVFFALGNWTPLATNSLGNLITAGGSTKQSLISLNWGDTDYFIGYIPGILGLIPKAGKYVVLSFSILVYLIFIIDGIIKKHHEKQAKTT